MRALVVEAGSTRGALAAVRHLTAAGWEAGVGSPAPDGLAFWSRRSARWHRVPGVVEDLDGFLDGIAAAVRAGGYEVVLPTSDGEALALALHRDRVGGAVVPLGPHGVVARAFDKLALTEAALAAGLDAPHTVVATDDAIEAATWPRIVKARFHWEPGQVGAPSRHEAVRCEDAAAARAAVAPMRAVGVEPLLQEDVAGEAVNLHVLADLSGEVRTIVGMLAPDRFFPPGAGRRTRSVVEAVPPALADGVQRFVRETGWTGFAGLAFLRTPAGRTCLIDFNGRVTASQEASRGDRANLVAAWAALATGREPAPLVPPAPGTSWQNLEADLRRALRERRGGLAHDVLETLRFGAGARHTILGAREPALAARYAALLVRRAASKRLSSGAATTA